MSVHGRQRCQETRRTSRGKLRTTIMSDQTGRALVPSVNGRAELVDPDASGRDLRDAQAKRQSQIFSAVHSPSSLIERELFYIHGLGRSSRPRDPRFTSQSHDGPIAGVIDRCLSRLAYTSQCCTWKAPPACGEGTPKMATTSEIRPASCPARRSGGPTSRALHRAAAAR